MHTKVKICGIKTQEEISILNQYPIQYMGFIFAPSKRQITTLKAEQLRKLVREDILVVGVFVNETAEQINEIIKLCNLQIVQLHGEESVDFCKKINAKVWKSISIKDENSLKLLEEYAFAVDHLLLDTYSDSEKGGTGKIFNWQLVRGTSKKHSIVLAGGLTPENIVDAIELVHPQVVDLNSGVETDLIKDEVKIRKVFTALKEALII